MYEFGQAVFGKLGSESRYNYIILSYSFYSLTDSILVAYYIPIDVITVIEGSPKLHFSNRSKYWNVNSERMVQRW